MTMKKLILFLILFFIIKSFYAQENMLPCATHIMNKKAFDKNPEKFLKNKQQLDSITNLFNTHNRFGEPEKIIPVVFHVLHEGNPVGVNENISKEQIEDAIRLMNEDFNAMNEDLSNVIDEFESIIGNVGVTYKLARIDPNGNCTEGITRTYWEGTSSANDDAKQVVFWDDASYLNIWVVKSIDANIGAAAYTYVPSAGGPNFRHGIIADHEYVGSIGTGSNSNYVRHTLSHECGHFFNLEHTWAEWADVGLSSNCSEDDFVDDTPNCIGSYSSCNLASQTCGSLDNVQNIMDYSSCTAMFTNGQVTRMQASLNSGVGDRVDLWQEDNLWETGTHPNYQEEECLATVDFYIPNGSSCLNTEVQFFNNTFNDGENPTYYWSFPGGIPSNSYEENPFVTYDSPGAFNVSLSVSTEAGTAYQTINDFITVFDNNPILSSVSESFESTNFPISSNPLSDWGILEQETENTWERTEMASSLGVASMRIRSRFFSGENEHNLYSPFINLSAYQAPVRLYFDYAYAKRNSQSDDLLTILISDDCGLSWTERKDLTTTELVTNGGSYISSAFIPNNDQWQEEYVNLNPWAGNGSVKVKFQFTGEDGNYLYIDNVRLGLEEVVLEDILSPNKFLIKRIDLLGRETINKNFYIEIFNDGTVKKHYKL